MSSVKLRNLFSREATTEVVGAVAWVAERSFYADVQPCDRRRFDDLARAAADSWLLATVAFREGACAGVLSCRVPRELARNLLDAFTGRDPQDAEPGEEALFDLVGELCNMICGTWLTRLGPTQIFTLSRPVVEASQTRPAVPADTLALMTVNDLPLAVSVTSIDEGARAAAGF